MYIMTTLKRRVQEFTLNEGSGMAKGLYNLSNLITLQETKDKGVSDWFDEETKVELMHMDSHDFVKRAKEMID